MKSVIVITGPTGVGKTRLSIALAKKFNGEIINADATQVYRGLDIGSAKIKEEEKEGIIHHLFDIKDVGEEYTIYHYQRDCRKKIGEIIDRGHVPILVGGTGLYIKSALYDYRLIESKIDASNFDGKTTDELYNMLIALDRDAIGVIDSHNRRRIINALVYYQENNMSITRNRTDKALYDACYIGLTTNRECLYQKINQRVDKMMDEGLLDEVRCFYDKKLFVKPLLSAIGYKELIKYLNGEVSLDIAIDEIKKNSRHYAKKQYTFFRHQLPVKWFWTNYDDFDQTVREVITYIENL